MVDAVVVAIVTVAGAEGMLWKPLNEQRALCSAS